MSFYTCSQCPYESQWDFAINSHWKQHYATTSLDRFNCSSEVELYSCNICAYTANLQTSVFEHLHLGHILETYTENGYNEVFTKAIDSNYPKVVNNEKQHECQQCGLRTFSKIYLLKHKERCIKKSLKSVGHRRQLDCTEWFKCPNCPFKTKNKPTLVAHGKYKHLPDHQAQWFKCEYCSFRTKYKHSYRNHKVSQHKSSKRALKEYKCPHCPFTTFVKDQLGKHNKRKHIPDDEVTWYECNECGHRTKRSDVSKKHRAICSINKQYADDSIINPNECLCCQFVALDETEMKAHFKLQHLSDDRRFECKLCHFKTKYKYSLIKHKTLKHCSKKKKDLSKSLN